MVTGSKETKFRLKPEFLQLLRLAELRAEGFKCKCQNLLQGRLDQDSWGTQGIG
jgi:hypothetical protein